jgi:hypothetical protein
VRRRQPDADASRDDQRAHEETISKATFPGTWPFGVSGHDVGDLALDAMKLCVPDQLAHQAPVRRVGGSPCRQRRLRWRCRVRQCASSSRPRQCAAPCQPTLTAHAAGRRGDHRILPSIRATTHVEGKKTCRRGPADRSREPRSTDVASALRSDVGAMRWPIAPRRTPAFRPQQALDRSRRKLTTAAAFLSSRPPKAGPGLLTVVTKQFDAATRRPGDEI